MSWKDKLQKASFRGKPFQVEADDAAFGRRVQLHEYPQRDKPYAEDMGRKAREISLTAFMIGPDYMAARDELLSAIEEVGPGTLVHPWYGQLNVIVKEDGCRVTHSHQDGGMCRIQLSFVEAGELAFPSSASAAGAGTLRAADTLQQVAEQGFADKFKVSGLPSWVNDSAISVAGGMLGDMDKILNTVGGVLASPASALKSELGALFGTPLSYAQRVFGLYAKSGAIVGGLSNLSFANFSSLNFLRALTTTRASSASSFSAVPRPVGNTAARTQLIDNQNALAALTRRSLLVQSAGMTAEMPMPVYEDAVVLRKELMLALDNEAATADDTSYAALMALRTHVHADMTARMRDSARLQEYRPREVLPSLVLAYDLYEDTGREGEIISRNRIRHPGFVPANPIKVVSA